MRKKIILGLKKLPKWGLTLKNINKKSYMNSQNLVGLEEGLHEAIIGLCGF